MDKSAIRFDRQYRTVASEGYNVRRENERIGRLDLHFTAQSVHGTLVLLEDVSEQDILVLIEHADESLVLSAEVPRDDFYVTAFRGEEIGFYSDDFQAERGGGVAVRQASSVDETLSGQAEPNSA